MKNECIVKSRWHNAVDALIANADLGEANFLSAKVPLFDEVMRCHSNAESLVSFKKELYSLINIKWRLSVNRVAMVSA